MDNIETTETKTEIKNGIAYIIGLVIVATIFGVLIWFKSGDREPFLFGYVWDANFILIFFQMVMFVVVFVSLIGQPKGKKTNYLHDFMCGYVCFGSGFDTNS